MNYTFEEVKKFILEFTELEYQVAITKYDSDVSNEEWKNLVAKLREFHVQVFGYQSTSNLEARSKTLMTEEILNNERKNLKKEGYF